MLAVGVIDHVLPFQRTATAPFGSALPPPTAKHIVPLTHETSPKVVDVPTPVDGTWIQVVPFHRSARLPVRLSARQNAELVHDTLWRRPPVPPLVAAGVTSDH